MDVYSLRRATTADVDFLTDVVLSATRAQGRLPADFDEAEYRAGFADWTREQMSDPVGRSETSVIVVDGRRVGRLRVVRDGATIELAGIQLLPASQSRGIGSRVISDLLDEATATQQPLVLSVERDNPRARNLYRRLGFVETGLTDNEITMQHGIVRPR